MSQPYRPTSASAGSSVPATQVLQSFRASNSSPMYTSAQAHYCFNPSPHPQFVATPVVYPSPLLNSQSGITLVSVPPPLQGLYAPVPCDQRKADFASNFMVNPPNLQRLRTSAPLKTQEEQRKFEKERNFQLQQQKLKQFTVAGKKGSLNAENLIDSIFGKAQPKKENQKIQKTQSDSRETRNSFTSVCESSKHTLLPPSTQMPFSGGLKTVVSPSGKENVNKSKRDPNVLENMMMECSDLSGPQKARTFQKPSIRELAPPSQQTASFSSSVKARDWSNLQGLDNAFLLPRPRFPAWCHKDHIPPLYHLVEMIVTNKGSHPPETNILYSILISSGLSHEVLGLIWELVNQTSPGHLTHDEMYAALALVAIAQAGHQIKSIDVLHELPKCPLPILHCFDQQRPSTAPDSPLPDVTNESNQIPSKPPDTVSSPDCNAGFKVPVASAITTATALPSRPRAITIQSGVLSNENLTDCFKNNASPFPTFTSSDAGTSSNDDDFDDFKSATPTAVGALTIVSSSSGPFKSIAVDGDDDEFGDFKQALCTSSDSFADFNSTEKISTVSLSSTDIQDNCEQDLISPDEDKYSVFRMLQQIEGYNGGDVEDTKLEKTTVVSNEVDLFKCDENDLFPPSNVSLPAKVTNVSSVDTNKMKELDRSSFSKSIDEALFLPGVKKHDNDFGNFLHAEVAAICTSSSALLSCGTFVCDFEANFADFSKLNVNYDDINSSQIESEKIVSMGTTWNSNASPDDGVFGEFASSPAFNVKQHVGQEFVFPHIKDNISIAESQSVSSLELGTIDCGGHSGESKSSLSRQGSIPSLDLKVSGLEIPDSEDGFGEMQCATNFSFTSKTPSPSNDHKLVIEKNSVNSSGFLFQQTSALPFIDKYSIIRSEQVKEDEHIYDWTRCVQSCLDILESATRNFNQMSCTSVCNEVLNSEEGNNFVKNVIEVYKVSCRIALVSKSMGKQADSLRHLLEAADHAWNTLTVFLTGSSIMPDESALDFSRCVLRADPENNSKACGLCLLDVDTCSKSFNRNEDSPKLTYGGRQYHSTCANLWVNCVDPLLPTLTLPQLL